MDVLNIITQTTVPIIFISAIGLLTLTFQNRYGRVKDSVYTFQKRKIEYTLAGEKEKAMRADEMLTFYQTEAKMIKNSMIAAFVSILFVIITSFTIMIKDIVQTTSIVIDIFMIVSFALAISSIVLSVILIIVSFVRSVKTLNHEIETDDEGIRFGL